MLSITSLYVATLLSFLARPTSAYWRMSCPGTVFTGRVDPIVNPGSISGHVHVVLGGNGFAPNMTSESTLAATCTSCSIKGDMSNYWTPLLYYRAQNGSFISVPMAGGGQGGTVYYQQRASYRGNDTITAFPRGFRMLAGNPDNRIVDGGGGSGGNTSQQAVNFACLDYSGNSHVPEGQLLPNASCPDGVRAQIYFPQCWDGVRLDSDDHRSHVAYPTRYNGGECPDSHPVPVMGLFYELLYDTARFPWWVPSDATQPFVFSMGDPTGRGFHGDFLSGWDVDILQNGINKKTTSDAGAAGGVTYDGIFEFPDVYGTDCSLPPLVNEQIEGVLDKLPGCNPVSATGASDLHGGTGCSENEAQTKLAVQTQQVFTDLTSSMGWRYLGCGNDTAGKPSLPTKLADSQNMTVQMCVRSCAVKGFLYAGLEYASQCFCGSSLPSSATPVANSLGDCHMKCAGDEGQICGDASRLSLYQDCGGDQAKCQNAFVGFIGQVGQLANNTTPETSTMASQITATETMIQATASSLPVPKVLSVTVAPVPASLVTMSSKSNSISASASLPPPSTISSAPSLASPSIAASPTTGTGSSGKNGSSTQQSQLPAGWQSLGCYTDPVSPRALQGMTLAWWGEPMTTTGCAAYCSSKGYSLAGTEFGEQCFCGDSLQGKSTKVVGGDGDGGCGMACKGDAAQICGGRGRLSLVGKAVAKRRRKRGGGR